MSSLDTIKVRVLSRIKRDGKYHAQGSELTIPRKEYDDRRAAEEADAMLTPIYLSLAECVAKEMAQQAAQAQQESAGNVRHAQVKANMQEANRIAAEAAALRTQREAEQARALAEAAQARSDRDKPRRGRPPLVSAS